MTIKKVTFLPLFLIIASSNAANTEHDSRKRNLRALEYNESRIIGGSKAPSNAYPWFVLGSGCGGSLIAPEIFITAAHCADYRFFDVTIGALCRSDVDKYGNNCGQYSERRFGVEFVTHPQYNNGNDGYDFKLVRLNQASTIYPVNIDHGFLSPSYVSGRDQLWTAGFGLESIGPNRIPDVLMHLEKKYVSFDECSRLYHIFEKDWIKMDRTMICVKNDFDFRSACFGDSGGPLYDATAKKLVGIVSTGPPDCARLPIIYASIASEVQWIKETVCELSSTTYKPSYCDKYTDAPFYTPSPSQDIEILHTESPTTEHTESLHTESPTIKSTGTLETQSPSIENTENLTTDSSSENNKTNQETYFQIISRMSSESSLKWCMATTNSTYNSRVTVKNCDTSDPQQIWSGDVRGLLHTKSNPNLCIQNVQSENALIMRTCTPIGDPIDSTFVYDQIHKSLIWLRNKGDFSTWGLRAVTLIGIPSDNINMNKVFLSKRNGDETQKWDIYFPPL